MEDAMLYFFKSEKRIMTQLDVVMFTAVNRYPPTIISEK